MSPTIIALVSAVPTTVLSAFLTFGALFSFDAGENTVPSMKILGYTGFASMPITIVATVATIVSQNNTFLALHALPVLGVAAGFIVARTENANNPTQNIESGNSNPPTL
jgi:hypothetical protein